MLLLDVIIILALVAGVVLGFKRGVFKSAVMFVGTIIVVILAFKLKNPISGFMYSVLPLLNLSGTFKGVAIVSILLYEVVAFVIAFSILYTILQVIVKLTGIFELALKFTILLALPSKILGAIFGFLQNLIFVYAVLFIISCLSFTIEGININDSYLAPIIMDKTPFVASIASDGYQAFEELYSLKETFTETTDTSEYNEEALKILVKYNIITESNVSKLIDSGKITVNDVSEIIKGE